MVKLKNKIIKINSLPEEKKDNNFLNTLITIVVLIIILIICIIIFQQLKPYIFKIDINKIIGKKINITECNTKDYIIIGKDKSYSLSLTDDLCKTHYYEGDIIIKNNEILFNDNLKGIINEDYNIIINNEIFESDKNE